MKSPSPSSDVRTLLHEKPDALLDECDFVVDEADFGQVLNDLDHFLYVKGRNFAKEVLEQKLQERIERKETTAEGKQCLHCKKNESSLQETQYLNHLQRTHPPTPPLSSVFPLHEKFLSRRRNFQYEKEIHNRCSTHGFPLLRSLVVSSRRKPRAKV